ncbi:MAG: hypothetical protein ABIO65_09730 [Nitrospiria bacterium]
MLERLRAKPSDPSTRELRRMREESAAAGTDVPKAVAMAKRYIELGRADGDPRYYGYAQAVLAPWWNVTEAPAMVSVMKGTIRQSYHDFDGALTDLATALRAEPGNLQAWMTSAMILQVRGRYPEAQRHCEPLVRAAARAPSLALFAATCANSVASFHGNAAPAYRDLQHAFERAGPTDATTTLWVLTVLADMAVRLGRVSEAETHFREALALGRKDAFLLAAYTDFLIDHRRSAEVMALLQHETRSDTLLLRLALAEQQVSAPALAEHIEMLRARFEAGRQRNDIRHLREEARFTLHLLHQPDDALKLAQADWNVQREPEDARILLEAALAADQPAAAGPVLDWLSETRLEDPALQRLRDQLGPR